MGVSACSDEVAVVSSEFLGEVASLVKTISSLLVVTVGEAIGAESSTEVAEAGALSVLSLVNTEVGVLLEEGRDATVMDGLVINLTVLEVLMDVLVAVALLAILVDVEVAALVETVGTLERVAIVTESGVTTVLETVTLFGLGGADDSDSSCKSKFVEHYWNFLVYKIILIYILRSLF